MPNQRKVNESTHTKDTWSIINPRNKRNQIVKGNVNETDENGDQVGTSIEGGQGKGEEKRSVCVDGYNDGWW